MAPPNTGAELPEQGQGQRLRGGGDRSVGTLDGCDTGQGGGVGNAAGDEAQDGRPAELLGRVVADGEVQRPGDDGTQGGEGQEPRVLGGGRMGQFPEVRDGRDDAHASEAGNERGEDAADVPERRVDAGVLGAFALARVFEGAQGEFTDAITAPEQGCDGVLFVLVLVIEADVGGAAHRSERLIEAVSLAWPDHDLDLLAGDDPQDPVELLDAVNVDGIGVGDVEP